MGRIQGREGEFKVKRIAITFACFVLGQIGYWAIELRERLEPTEAAMGAALVAFDLLTGAEWAQFVGGLVGGLL